jgi:hypothetical protein
MSLHIMISDKLQKLTIIKWASRVYLSL